MNTYSVVLGPFEIGRVLRKHFVYQMQVGAMNYNVDLKVAENKGFLISSFHFHLSGEENDVNDFVDAVKEWCNNFENR